jgi:hypothetical protein
MKYEASIQAALQLVAVHGSEAEDVARDCVRAVLRRADQGAVASWLEILDAVPIATQYAASSQGAWRMDGWTGFQEISI